MLYQLDIGHQDPDEVIDAAIEQSQLDAKNREFALDLVRGALAHQAELDAQLTEIATDWALDRQAAVDRNILRLAAFEIVHRPDAPVAAVVNEAVELAKKYSTNESGRFVNGVLGALARRPRGDAAAAPAESAPECQDEESTAPEE
jgi:N utilization substance protein B